MKQVSITLICCLALLLGTTVNAQINTPQPSPSSKVEQKVGLTDVTVEYSRPGMKDRKIYGELVQFGEMWRTGANASTKITFSDDVKVGGKELKKGKYALYTIPGKDEWAIIFYNNTSFWGTPGDKFSEEDVAAKIMVQPKQSGMTFETFTIDINHLRNSSAHINLMWENTVVSIPLEVEVNSRVEKDIENVLAGPSSRDYYTAARFYYDNDKDMKQAHTWVVKANEMDAKFWQLRLQSLIEAKLGKTAKAIESAKKSMAMAKEAGNMDYVRMNEKSIAEWTKKS